MRLISTNVLQEGMVIARTIWNEAGLPLLQTGVVTTTSIIYRLNQLNIKYVYIEDAISKNIEIKEVVSPAIRTKAVSHIQNSFKNVKNTNLKQAAYILEKHTKLISNIVDDLLNTITDSKELLMVLSDAYLHDEYLYQHSFQVTMYSIAVAKEMGYSYEDQRTIGLGAILHDVGKMVVPLEVLKKPGKLTEEEFKEIKKHTTYGFDILRNLHSVSLLVAHCAYQHHERNDGSGYPRGIIEKDIHPFAKIIAVADVFDAVTSNRVYRDKLLPSEGLKIIEASKGICFDKDVVDAFKRIITVYPNGLVVLLSDGRRGVVARQNTEHSLRPIIRIFEENGKILNATYEVNLHSDLTVSIVKEEPDYHLMKE